MKTVVGGWWLVVGGVLAASGLPAVERSYTLYQGQVDNWSWDDRLAASEDPRVFSGFSRRTVDVKPGWWGRGRVLVGSAGSSMPYLQPGEAPVQGGAFLHAEAEIQGATGIVFGRIAPGLTLGGEDVPNPYLNDVWNRSEPTVDLDADQQFAPRATVGVVVAWHTLALSNEPFQWGEGIFGSPILGRSWQTFPHLTLSPAESFELGAPWDIPLTLRYEFVLGLQTGERPAGSIEDPLFIGWRVALRFGGTTLSGTLGSQAGGDGAPRPSLSDIVRSDTSDDAAGSNLNRMVSVGLSQWLGQRVLIGVEYAIDDWNPFFAPGAVGDLGKLNGWHPLTAGWTATLDWVDVTGDGSWRVATEWFRSEAYFYEHGNYGSWTENGYPLAHADGGNANSVRLLIQTIMAEGTQLNLIGMWRRIGWRNRDDGNINDRPGRTQAAPVPWDTVGPTMRTITPFASYGDLVVDAGLDLERNRLNLAGDSVWNAHLAVGWQKAF